MWKKRYNIIQFDVDDTLITSNYDKTDQSVLIRDPHSNNGKMYINPIVENIELLKKCKEVGFSITVHSQGGVDWVEAVLNGLGIGPDLVDEIADKPWAIVDDLDSFHWIRYRLYAGKEPRAGSNALTALKSVEELVEAITDNHPYFKF
jgi:hypothetical protein